MRDPYNVLNLTPSADAVAIKRAYRTLAKSLHPDHNPGDLIAEQQFKEVNRAYQLLSDPVQRGRYDRGEIDAEGRRRGRRRPDFGGTRQAERPSTPESFFERIFGRDGQPAPQAARRANGSAQRSQRAAGGEAALPRRLEVDFLAAARGGRQPLVLDSGRVLQVTIAPGTESGKILRLRSSHGGGATDMLVQVTVTPHPYFVRKGYDIHLELPVSLPEAVFGAQVMVPTIDGPVRVRIEPGANSGQSLRLKDRGLVMPVGGRGDQFVRLILKLPTPLDAGLKTYLKRWSEHNDYPVREAFEEE